MKDDNVFPGLSVIVITKNEADNIADCLRSVSFANEIIVLDGASEDATCEIARQLGAKVHCYPDWAGFGIQKNRALALAQQPWVLSIDADERVTPELASSIQRAMETGAHDAFEIPRMTQFCGRWIRHCGWTPDYVLRLFKRGSAHFSNDLVHERLLTQARSTGRLSAPLLHYSYPSPTHYWRKLELYSQAWAQQRWALGQRTNMGRAVLSGIIAFVRSYFFRLGFLDGAMGIAVCTMQAQAAFGKYFALYCLSLKDDFPND